MAGGDPGGGVHQDGCIQTHIVGAFLDELLHPRPFHVVLKFHAQGAVVPGVGKPAVNFGTGVDKSTVLAEIYDHVQSLFTVFHCFLPPNWLFPGKFTLLYMASPGKSRLFANYSPRSAAIMSWMRSASSTVLELWTSSAGITVRRCRYTSVGFRCLALRKTYWEF